MWKMREILCPVALEVNVRVKVWRCLHYWTRLVTKTCLIFSKWREGVARVTSNICKGKVLNMYCPDRTFWVLPYFSHTTQNCMWHARRIQRVWNPGVAPELARVEPYQTYTGPVEDWCVITAWQAITTACITTAWKDRDQWSTRERRRRKDVKSPLSP